MVFITNFFTTEILDTTKTNTEYLANTTEELMNSKFLMKNPEGAITVLCKDVTLMSESTGSDVYICDPEGNVIICPETLKGFQLTTDLQCEIHDKYKVPETYIQQVKHGSVSEFSTLGTVYQNHHSVCMEPFYVNNNFTGFCVIATPLTGTISDNLQRVIVMFLLSAAISLVIITIVVYIMTGKIAKPIRSLENATSCYAVGDFSYRVPEINSNDELSSLITKFNAMANSLAQLEESRRSFVANVSHEFKTPMTTIGGFINGILDGTIPPEKQEYYLKIVSSEIDRLSKMVSTMLNISRFETGNVDMALESINIRSKLIAICLGFEQLISNKKIEITGFDDMEDVTTHGDSAMIDQVIYNLIDNAVKFTNEGGKITLKTRSDKKYSYFSVTNTGKGIPSRDLDKVFDRFYKVDQSRSTDVKSTGLGLFLIKSIVNLHNGTITVESVENEYTTFTVKLPK